MKKLISILLVAMLVIGMFPATALTAAAADTTIVFEFGANGTASHKDGSSNKTTYSDTNGDYTLSLTGGTNMYPGSYDAKGNSCIKLGSSSKTGGFNFTVPAEVTQVVIAVGKYKANTSKVSINGTTHTLTGASNDGAYDAIEVDTSTNKTVTLITVSGGVRAMVNSITYVISGGSTEPENPDVPACEHSNQTEQEDGYAATCTEAGKTNSVICGDCGETITAQEEIPALGHKCDANGFCSVCEQTVAVYQKAVSGTVLKAGDKVIIAASDYNYAMSTTQNPNNRAQVEIRPQNNQIADPDASVQILTLEAGTQSGTFAFNTGSGYLFAASSSGNHLKTETTLSDNSSWTISVDANGVATIIAQGINSRATMQYNQTSSLFACYASASQKALSLYVLPTVSACAHDNMTQQVVTEADCENAGSYIWDCPDCDEDLGGGTIEALGHNYVDGVCTREGCGALDPMASLPGTYYIATKRSSGNYWYMTSDLGTASTKRYQAVDSGLTELPASIAESEAGFVFEVVANGDGTYSVLAVGVDGNNYLGWTTGNSGALVSEDAAKKLTFAPQENGSYHVSFDDRYLQLNNSAGSNYFAWYTSSQARDLFLIPAEVPAAEPVINGYVDGAWTAFTSVDAALTASNGNLQLIAAIGGIEYDGNLYLDLNGFAATGVTATKIYAYDSTATVSKEGTGKLTTTSEVVLDNTVNGKRYIALKGDTYTFHVLEMDLTYVTLRTSNAGLYYKAKVNCDDTLAGKIESYGVVLSRFDIPGSDFATEKNNNGHVNAWTHSEGAPVRGVDFTSGSVFGILKNGNAENDARGKVNIYANAYITIDGVAYVADGATQSLFNVMQKVDAMYATSTQKDIILKFYKTWRDVMSGWNLTNLEDAANAA